jgi:hypothetical protein
MRFFNYIVGLFFLMVICSQSFAQKEDCEQTLNHAQEEFNAGHFYGLSSMLKSCVDHGFTREQRQRAYLLLTQAYLLLDDPIAAEDSYLKLLKANPEFVTDPNRDPMDVVYLSKKFTASPILSVFGKLGANVSPVSVIRYNYISDSKGVTENYSLRPGLFAGVGVDWNITDNISATGELNYSSTAYKDVESNIFLRDSKEVIDKQNWFTIPLSIKYSDNVGLVRPYGYFGFSASILLADKINITSLDNSPGEAGQEVNTQSSESPILDFKYKRNNLNRSLFLGGGVRYKWKLDYFFIDLRYSFGLSNITNLNALYQGDAVTRWAHVDDLMRLNNLAFSLGYVHPLYKPRKLKNARTKSVLKDIKKQKGDVQQN